MSKSLDEWLADQVENAIVVKKEHKDRVRMFYNNYMCYLNKNGVDYDIDRFKEVDGMFMDYINDEPIKKKEKYRKQ